MCLWVLLWCALWCALCRMFRDDSAAGSGSEDEEGSEGSAGSMDDFLNDSPVASPMQVMGSPTQQTAPPSWSSGGRHPRTPGSGNPAERQRPRRASNAVTSPSRPPLLARTERNPQLAELQHELDFLADNFGDLTPTAVQLYE